MTASDLLEHDPTANADEAEIDDERQVIVESHGTHDRLQPGESCPLSRTAERRFGPAT